MEPTTPTSPGSVAAATDPCPQCDSEGITTRWVDDVITWGSGDLKSRIPVSLPVRTCPACDLQYIDHHGERLHHEAICRHLGVLSPADIRSIRRSYGMSTAAFAHATGLGEATISRWENGLVIQNHANDRYVRLLAMPHVMRAVRLMSMDTPQSVPPHAAGAEPRFRLLRPTEVHRREQQHFQLRRAS